METAYTFREGAILSAAELRIDAGARRVYAAGCWTVPGIAGVEDRIRSLSRAAGADVRLDGSQIAAMDISGAWLLHRAALTLGKDGGAVPVEGLRPEFEALLRRIGALAGPSSSAPHLPTGLLESLGRKVWGSLRGATEMLAFVGESAVALARVMASPRRIRWRPILHNLQTSGFEALPITGLLAFLMGIVVSYQGATQLERFGANIFIADLVGLSMLRELSPLVTAIIVAGRSGSAYTAQIGTMKVTEEIDALRTIGVVPQELLVLPKMLALVVALPLLTVYTDVAGVLGGMIMARTRLDVDFSTFLDRLSHAVSVSSYLTGVAKAPVFAAVIAVVGCYRGFRVADSADSVGRETTASVVQSIFLVIVIDALFSVIFNWLNI